MDTGQLIETCGKLYEGLIAALNQQDPEAAQHFTNRLLDLTEGSTAPLAMMLRGQTLRICATVFVQRGEMDGAVECLRRALALRRQLGESDEGKCLALDLATLPLLLTRENRSAKFQAPKPATIERFFLRLLSITLGIETREPHALRKHIEAIPLTASETQRVTIAALSFGVGLSATDSHAAGSALAWLKQSARLLDSLHDVDPVYLEFAVDLAGRVYMTLAFERQRGQDILGMRAQFTRFDSCLETMGLDAATRRRHTALLRAGAELNVAIDGDDDAGIRDRAKEVLRLVPSSEHPGSSSRERLEALASGRKSRPPPSGAILGDPGRAFQQARDPAELDPDTLIVESIKALAGSDRQLRWRSAAMLIHLGGEDAEPHRAALGIFFGKLSLRELVYFDAEVLQHGYPRIAPFADPMAARVTSDVVRHLVARGRLGEAQRLQMLLDIERANIPSSSVRDPERRVDDECPLTPAERRLTADVLALAHRFVGGWRSSDIRGEMERLARRLEGSGESHAAMEFVPPGPDAAMLRVRTLNDRIDVTLAGTRGQRVVRLEQRAAELNQLVFLALRSLRRREREGLTHCRTLYDLLVRPFQEELRRWSPEILVIDAPGVLRHVPFAVMHDGERYLIESHALVVHPGLVSIDAARGIRMPIRLASVAVSQSGELPAIPATAAESDFLCGEIRRLSIGSVEQRLNDAVTPEFLQSLPGLQPTLLHMATHFETHATDAGHSGFALADGSRFTLSQLAQLDLRSVDLALVTGCASRAVSDFPTDTGITALDTLLLRMGVGSVISTAWPVMDTRAHQVLREFIAPLIAGSLDQARALQHAMLTVGRDPSTGLMRDPVEWGAYVLSGGWAGCRPCE